MTLTFHLVNMILRSWTMIIMLMLSNHAIHGQEDCGVRTHLTTSAQQKSDRGVYISDDGSIIARTFFVTERKLNTVLEEWNNVTGQWHSTRLAPMFHWINVIDISADRNRMVVGGTTFNPKTFSTTVLVAVFQRTITNSTQTWVMVGAPIAACPNGYGVLSAVTISATGSTIAFGVNAYGKARGRVRVYEQTAPTKDWVQVGPTFVGNMIQSRYGESGLGGTIDISADGRILIVGESRVNSAYVYQRINESPTVVKWNPMGSVIFGPQENQAFGRKVVLSADGTIFAVAAKLQIAVYKFDATVKEWKQMGSGFGLQYSASSSLSMSADGSTIAFELERTWPLETIVNVYTWGGNKWKKVAVGEIPSGYGVEARISADGKVLSVIDVFTFSASLFELNKSCNVITCDPTWNFYNSDTGTLFKTFDNLIPVILIPRLKTNGTRTEKRSNATNIEGIFPCGAGNDTSVLMELQKADGDGFLRPYYSRLVKPVNGRYFLYGAGSGGMRNLPTINIFPGYLPSGTYTIRARVGGKYTSRTRFMIL